MSDPIARSDQAKSEIQEVPPILGAFFHGLLRQGFERCEAMELTRDLQASMISGEDDED